MITKKQIELLAYILYQQEGKPDGRDKEHWLRAERILTEQEVLLEVGESVSEHYLAQVNNGDTEVNPPLNPQEQSTDDDSARQTLNVNRTLQDDFANMHVQTRNLLTILIKDNILSEMVTYFFFGAICVVVFLIQKDSIPISMYLAVGVGVASMVWALILGYLTFNIDKIMTLNVQKLKRWRQFDQGFHWTALIVVIADSFISNLVKLIEKKAPDVFVYSFFVLMSVVLIILLLRKLASSR